LALLLPPAPPLPPGPPLPEFPLLLLPPAPPLPPGPPLPEFPVLLVPPIPPSPPAPPFPDVPEGDDVVVAAPAAGAAVVVETAGAAVVELVGGAVVAGVVVGVVVVVLDAGVVVVVDAGAAVLVLEAEEGVPDEEVVAVPDVVPAAAGVDDDAPDAPLDPVDPAVPDVVPVPLPVGDVVPFVVGTVVVPLEDVDEPFVAFCCPCGAACACAAGMAAPTTHAGMAAATAAVTAARTHPAKRPLGNLTCSWIISELTSKECCRDVSEANARDQAAARKRITSLPSRVSSVISPRRRRPPLDPSPSPPAHYDHETISPVGLRGPRFAEVQPKMLVRNCGEMSYVALYRAKISHNGLLQWRSRWLLVSLTRGTGLSSTSRQRHRASETGGAGNPPRQFCKDFAQR
jgi:hypothetical protein